MPDAQNGSWPGDGWGDYGGGGGGGGIPDVSAPTGTTDNKAAGVALASKTFGAFTGADVGDIDNYNLVTLNSSGSCSWSGSGLGAYTPTSADGDAGSIQLQARNSSNEVLATAVHDYHRAPASDSPTVIFSSAAVDDYDFTTTGGTSGTGGAGTHTLSDDTVVTIDETGTGPTTCEFSGGKLLVGGGDASNFYNLMFDLGSNTQYSTVFFRALVLATVDSTASGTIFKFAETSTAWGNVQDDLSVLALGGTASNQTVRFRYANSSTNFNDFLNVASMDLSAGEAVEIYVDSSNPGASVGAEAGTTVPSWKVGDLTAMNADTRSALASHRRYFYVRAKEQDLSLDFTLSHNR